MANQLLTKPKQLSHSIRFPTLHSLRWNTINKRVECSVVYTLLTGGRTMRLSLKGRIAKIFNQVFVGGVGDAAWRDHNSTAIEDVTGGLDIAAHAIFIIIQSHSVEACVKPALSRAQAVKLDTSFAQHVASRWRISETKDIWFQRIWYWRGRVVLVSEVLHERS